MKALRLLPLIILLSFTGANVPDCRSFAFGSSMESVRKGETAQFVKKEDLLHNINGLTFMEMTDTLLHVYVYSFYHDKLTGLKTKYMAKDGNNTFVFAHGTYQKILERYKAMGSKVDEKMDHQHLSHFRLTFPTKYVQVQMVKDHEDYYVTEGIVKK